MRVFGLTTGRSGSTTLTRAFSHATNFTAAHESRHELIGEDRFDYPDQHVEVDLRLSFLLGALDERFPTARYIHLTRDPEAVAASMYRRLLHPPAFATTAQGPVERVRRRWQSRHPGPSIISAFGYGVIFRHERWSDDEAMAVCRFYVDVVNANIDQFLHGRDHRVIRLEHAADTFPDVWRWVGASGDMAAAMAELRIRHNADG